MCARDAFVVWTRAENNPWVLFVKNCLNILKMNCLNNLKMSCLNNLKMNDPLRI